MKADELLAPWSCRGRTVEVWDAVPAADQVLRSAARRRAKGGAPYGLGAGGPGAWWWQWSTGFARRPPSVGGGGVPGHLVGGGRSGVPLPKSPVLSTSSKPTHPARNEGWEYVGCARPEELIFAASHGQ